MSDVPRPQDPYPPEFPPRKAARRAQSDPEPLAAPAPQLSDPSCGPTPEISDDYLEEIANTLSGLAPPDQPIPAGTPPAGGRRGGRRLHPPTAAAPSPMTAEQRLLLLDTWLRSGLPAADFAALVGLSKHTLYDWKRKFQAEGPAGLVDRPRGSPPGSRLPEVTRRAILMLDAKQSFAKTRSQTGVWERGATVFGNDVNEVQLPLVPKLPFGNARLRNSVSLAFTFVLKRQNRRVYLVGFLDDHSRFLVSYGLHASQSSALVLEVLRAGLANYGPPEEILTDNGSQYVTWRGKSAFSNQNETEFQREGLRENLSFPNSCLGTSLPETLFRFRLVDSVTE